MKFEEHKIEVVLFSEDEAFVTGAGGSNHDLGHFDGTNDGNYAS